jgi:tetratricopeptide (TPR) repeat protein
MKLSRTRGTSATSIVTAFAFSALAISVSAGAEEQELPYTMTAITDASFGNKVMAGQYEQAIQYITAPNYHRKASFEAKTNLCVAYTKTGAIGQAEESCSAAIADIRNDHFRQERSRSDLALALSNRGVLRAVKGENELARQDFADAVALDSGLKAPSTNLARFDSQSMADAYSAN